jgi:hypothetical protein
MRRHLAAFVSALAVALLLLPGQPRGAEPKPPTRDELLTKAVADLVAMQEEGGQWPYEGVYRVERQIPIGYRVGGTAIVAGTLLAAAPQDRDAQAAVRRGLEFVLKELKAAGMEPSTKDVYDVRVWGHAMALEFLCQVRAAKAAGERGAAVDEAVRGLVKTLLTEEIEGGGWNYANHHAPASFVTAPVVQALLWARSQGETVPDEVFDRARKVLEAARAPDGAFAYSGSSGGRPTRDKLAGSSARSAVCETTLLLLGGGGTKDVQAALDAFHANWDELAKRRQKQGTHEGPYSIAPYYFYYGHRYAAQAIEVLPEESRAKERERLVAVLLKTREMDGTWNDRVFPRSRNYGTAMATLVLLADRTPLPPRWKKQ